MLFIVIYVCDCLWKTMENEWTRDDFENTLVGTRCFCGSFIDIKFIQIHSYVKIHDGVSFLLLLSLCLPSCETSLGWVKKLTKKNLGIHWVVGQQNRGSLQLANQPRDTELDLVLLSHSATQFVSRTAARQWVWHFLKLCACIIHYKRIKIIQNDTKCIKIYQKLPKCIQLHAKKYTQGLRFDCRWVHFNMSCP